MRPAQFAHNAPRRWNVGSWGDGNFYGTTLRGGVFDRGIVFRLTSAGGFTILHHFGDAADGAYSQAALIQADDGNLYGTTGGGGTYGHGTVFRMTLDGVVFIMTSDSLKSRTTS